MSINCSKAADVFSRLVHLRDPSKQHYLDAKTTQGKRTAGSRRTWVHSKWAGVSGGVNYLTTEECEVIRLMLDVAWGAEPTEGKNEYEHVARLPATIAMVDIARKFISKEPTVNETAKSTITTITVDNVTMINGEPASNYSDAQLYRMIAKEEAAIEELSRIKNKPKRLEAEIARRQAGIEKLVTYLDSQG